MELTKTEVRNQWMQKGQLALEKCSYCKNTGSIEAINKKDKKFMNQDKKKRVNLSLDELTLATLQEISDKNIAETYSESIDKELNVIRILHSPSLPVAKGTIIIVDAIERLKKKGYQIEFVLIKGRPFSEVLKEIQGCHFVIDQIYSDTPMAAFAAEAAWYGKPAIVGGYALDRLKKFVPEGMWPPSKTCLPEEIEGAIEELIVNHEQRKRLGREAQSFVREKWAAVEVAKRFLKLIEGEIPEGWWVDPMDVLYLEGCGQSNERTKNLIRTMVSHHGLRSLHLSHRPDLEKAFLDFANIKHS